MANVYLQIAGAVAGVAAAAIGALSVPGIVDSVNDSAVVSDLSQVALAEEAAVTVAGSYVQVPDLIDGDVDGESIGVKYQPSAGVVTEIAVSADGGQWVGIGVSKSGHVFVRTSDATTTYKSTEKIADGATIAAADFDSLPAGVTVGGTKTAPTISLGS